MDVVWMEQFKVTQVLNSEKGQGVVEYILLIAVITSIAFTILNSKKFKEFTKGNKGFVRSMQTGISYSYRYGRDYQSAKNAENAQSFNYESGKHDTYLNDEGKSHYFFGLDHYP